MKSVVESAWRDRLIHRSTCWALDLLAVAAISALLLARIQCGAVSRPADQGKAAPAEGGVAEAAGPPGAPSSGFALTSSAFQAGGNIPAQFSCQGADTSPALAWTDPPARTQSFGLIVDDPDAPAGTWVHWVAYDLPANRHGLPEGVPKQEEVPGGGRQGLNDFRKVGYGGPCPPPGKPHRYFFKLYALDAKLNLKPGATKRALEEAMKGHLLSHAELIGRFGR
jgi:Raf kinase inhibitor-like YbhB/YbcL family protein